MKKLKWKHKRNRTNKKIKFTLNKNTFKKSKIKTRRKRRKYDRFNRKNSKITQTKIPLLKIHKENFSIFSKENNLSLSESDSFRLIEKSDKNEI